MRRFLIVLVVTLMASVGLSVPRAAGASALTRSNAAKTKMYTVKGVQVYGFLAVDAQGNVYSDSGTSSLVKLSPRGKELASWNGVNFAANGPGSAAGVALDSQGNVYVVDSVANKVVKLSSNLQTLAEWGGYGTAPGQFIEPEGIALDAQGNMYVADLGNARVQKLAPDGSVLAVWNDGGKLRDPYGITLDTEGTVYVADPYYNQIFKLSPSGQEVGMLDSSVLAGDVIDLVVDSAGRVYAADSGSQHILKFSAAGKYVGAWVADAYQVFNPTGIARSPSGTIYASECPNQSGTALRCRIVKWSSKGKPAAIWNSGTQGSEPGSTIDMGGYGLHLYCTGQGSPTVIFESTFSASSGEWWYLQPQLATQTRVCSYDEPGTGESNTLPTGAKIPGVLQETQQLHALLQKANVAGPYIFAAHSSGGLISRMFAATYPAEVAGMVLIDSVNENQFVNPGIWGNNGQTLDMALSVDQIHSATKNTIKGSLGNIPLITLTENADLTPCGDCYASPSQWYQFQAALASASSDSVQVMALRSGFGIPWNQPGLVVEAVREVIAAARSANHALPACGAAFQQLDGKCMS